MENNKPKQYITPYEPFTIRRVFIKDKQELEDLSLQAVNKNLIFLILNYFGLLFSSLKIIQGINRNFSPYYLWCLDYEFIRRPSNEYLFKINSGEIIDDSANNSYLDFAKSEQDYLHTPRFQKDKEFWNTFFDSEPEPSLISDQKEKL